MESARMGIPSLGREMRGLELTVIPVQGAYAHRLVGHYSFLSRTLTRRHSGDGQDSWASGQRKRNSADC